MKNTKFLFLLILIIINAVFCSYAQALWMWTPETGKWVNPKYSVKDTPAEQLQLGVDLYSAKEYDDAIKEFKKLIKYYPKAREAADAQYYVGACLEAQGFLSEAFKEYQTVIEKYPFGGQAPEIIERQYYIANQVMEGKDRHRGWVKSVTGERYDVVKMFETIIQNGPYGSFAAPAQYKMGLYLMEKNRYQEARDEFDKTINDYPGTEWAKAAQYQIAMADAKRSATAQYEQATTQAAAEQFEEFVKEYPSADLSDEAKAQIRKLRDTEAENNFVIAEFYLKHKNYKSAKIYLKDIVDNYPNTPWSVKALRELRKIPN